MITALHFASHVLSGLGQCELLGEQVQRGEHYSVHRVSKRDGSTRFILKPDPLLNFVLKKSNEFFGGLNIGLPDHVYGFVKGRSIVDNARNHLAKPVVLRIDLRHFFESISSSAVKDSLRANGFDEDAAELCSRLMTVEQRLPIGFATSPFLSNLAFSRTDSALATFAAEQSLAFTRYVDDLVFSGQVERSNIAEVTQILESHGWAVNERKTAFMKKGGKQYVTGLSVSDAAQPRIPVQTKRRLRLKLHLIEKFGYDMYMDAFGGDDFHDHPRKLLGLARYVASVEPTLGHKMLQSFDSNLSDSWYGQPDDEYWREWLED
jgi:Reverse transcriptase (RNA-dependent DNA polymerase)